MVAVHQEAGKMNKEKSKYLINAEQHAQISAAITKAEQGTSGEVYAVLARRSDDYFFAAGFVVTCGILLSAVIAAFMAHLYWFNISLPAYGLAILAAFLMAMLILWFVPQCRVFFVPKQILFKRAHLNAVQQFLSKNIHQTKYRTGVLLFVSLEERYATVIADSGINSKVDQAQWNKIVGILLQHAEQGEIGNAFIEAISQTGQLLQLYAPAIDHFDNELQNSLVELL